MKLLRAAGYGLVLIGFVIIAFWYDRSVDFWQDRAWRIGFLVCLLGTGCMAFADTREK